MRRPPNRTKLLSSISSRSRSSAATSVEDMPRSEPDKNCKLAGKSRCAAAHTEKAIRGFFHANHYAVVNEFSRESKVGETHRCQCHHHGEPLWEPTKTRTAALGTSHSMPCVASPALSSGSCARPPKTPPRTVLPRSVVVRSCVVAQGGGARFGVR